MPIAHELVAAIPLWSTLRASTYWNIRLSGACSAKDAQVQSEIFLSYFTRNLVVVGRQPHPDPNFASCVLSGRPLRLAVAPSTSYLRTLLRPTSWTLECPPLLLFIRVVAA